MLPYLEQQNLYDKLDLNGNTWNDTVYRYTAIPAYVCPSYAGEPVIRDTSFVRVHAGSVDDLPVVGHDQRQRDRRGISVKIDRIQRDGARWVVLLVFVAMAGCDRAPERAPVEGIVLFEGKPLQAGTVMFQPVGGQPSQARIRSDGTFTMETCGYGPGAVVGHCRVAVTCFESDVAGGGKNDADEVALGRSLVPERYAQYATSGIEVDVQPGQNERVRIELSQ